jgi:hypothetical protein
VEIELKGILFVSPLSPDGLELPRLSVTSGRRLLKQSPDAVPGAPAVHAGDPRCNAPPYGGTVVAYKAFVSNFGHLAISATMLPGICNAKYGGADRTGLYNLGFTEIDSKDTEELAVDTIIALKNLADKLPNPAFGR